MRKLKRLVLLLIVLTITRLILICSQVAVASDSVAVNDWQPAALAAPPGLMEQVVKEHIKGEWLGDPGRMRVIKIQQSGQQNPLYLINTRIIHDCPPQGCNPLQDPLCGRAGCAYLGYVQNGKSYRQVFNEYLNSLLPPEVPFMRVSNQLASGLPCLQFTQLENTMSDRLRLSRFCYDGRIYKRVDESLQKNFRGRD